MKRIIFLIASALLLVSSLLLTETVKADEVNPYPGAEWIEHTGNCQVQISGEAGFPFSVFGIQFTIPASGEITLTFYDVKVSCEAGGNMMCEYMPCWKFWKGNDLPGSLTAEPLWEGEGGGGPE